MRVSHSIPSSAGLNRTQVTSGLV